MCPLSHMCECPLMIMGIWVVARRGFYERVTVNTDMQVPPCYMDLDSFGFNQECSSWSTWKFLRSLHTLDSMVAGLMYISSAV